MKKIEPFLKNICFGKCEGISKSIDNLFSDFPKPYSRDFHHWKYNEQVKVFLPSENVKKTKLMQHSLTSIEESRGIPSQPFLTTLHLTKGAI